VPDKPQPLDYGSPVEDRVKSRLGALTGGALTIGALSMIRVVVPDRGGMYGELRMIVGIFGGAIGLGLAVVALLRLLWGRKFDLFKIAAAAFAIVCATTAIGFGVRLYWR
jgi:hypothetical protein